MNFEACKELVSEAPMGIAYLEAIRAPDGRVVDLRFLMINESFENITGITKAITQGKMFSEFSSENANMGECCKQLMQQISEKHKINEICHDDRECKRFFRVSITDIKDDRFAVYLYDITEEKNTILALESLKEDYDSKSEQVERFFSVNLDLLCIADTDGNFIKLNKAWETTLGYSLDELYKHNFFDFIHPDDINSTHESVERLVDQTEVVGFVNRYRTANGHYKFIEWRSHPYGKYIYAAARDITDRVRYINEQKKIMEALRLSEEKYRLIAENIGDVIWIYNIDKSKLVYMSPSVYRQRGYIPDEMLGDGFKKSMTPASLELLTERVAEYYKEFVDYGVSSDFRAIECEQISKDGTVKWVEVSITFKRNSNNEVEIYGVTRDVSYRKKAEALQYIGNHDQLTGLYNRHFFETIILEEMKRSDRYSDPISLIMFDIDHFKFVNDTWGHPVGDELLKLIARVTLGVIRSSDIFVRFGGEEFLVLMTETECEGAVNAAEKIRQAIEKINHPVTGKQTVSLGVAERNPSESFMDWYKRVDKAMYAAKRLGRNRVVKSD